MLAGFAREQHLIWGESRGGESAWGRAVLALLVMGCKRGSGSAARGTQRHLAPAGQPARNMWAE
jgi:hypothetical protein